MTTSILDRSNPEPYDKEFFARKFQPQLKLDSSEINSYSLNSIQDKESKNLDFFSMNLKEKLENLKFSFPSINPERISHILGNNNISLENCFETIKNLNLSDKKNDEKKEVKGTGSTLTNKNYFPKFLNDKKTSISYKRKRNHNELVTNKTNKNLVPSSNNSNNNNTENNNITRNIPEDKNEDKKNIQSFPKEEPKEKKIPDSNIINQSQSQIVQKEINIEKNICENINKREITKNVNKPENNEIPFLIPKKENLELKTVSEVANDLLKCKKKEELKEYLFDQLQLLDEKKRTENKVKEMKQQIDEKIKILERDFKELRHCNTVVSRAYIKKKTELHTLGLKVNKNVKEIENKMKQIQYHSYMGDLYRQEFEELNK